MAQIFKSSFFFFSICFTLTVQSQIVERGTILYERKINTYSIVPGYIKGSDLVAADQVAGFLQKYRAEQPQFSVDSFQLTFDDSISFYEPLGNVSSFLNGVGVPMAEKNKVYMNLLSNRYSAEKNAYYEKRLINDTITKIRWKLTDEIREIAGFECRRANALINDSIYIVAFYTDAIKTKSGPELFQGLPGMILGVALPHYHVSYFATKVNLIPSSEKLTPPSFIKEGKKIKRIDYINEMLTYLQEKKLNNPWIQVFIQL